MKAFSSVGPCASQPHGIFLTRTEPQLNISFVSSEFYRLLFYARDPIITSDGFGKTGVMEFWINGVLG
jgi:hypothetical protein